MTATRYELQQGTQEWLDWRLSGITATEASCAMGVSKWGTALSVYNDKLNPKQHEPSEYEEWGSLLEDVIKFKKFAKEHPEFEVRQGACYEREWRKCSLDGELWKDGKCIAILEIKTGSSSADWNPVPDGYYAQVQWQMHVTGIHTTYFAVLIHGHEYFERQVEYDPIYVEKLEEKCQLLWNCIQNRVPPEPDPVHADIDQALVAEAAVTNGERDDEYEISDEEYATFIILRDKCKELEQKLAAQKLLFTKYLYRFQRLTYKGAKFATMVSMKGRDTIDAKRLKEDFPDVYDKVFKKGKPSFYPKFG